VHILKFLMIFEPKDHISIYIQLFVVCPLEAYPGGGFWGHNPYFFKRKKATLLGSVSWENTGLFPQNWPLYILKTTECRKLLPKVSINRKGFSLKFKVVPAYFTLWYTLAIQNTKAGVYTRNLHKVVTSQMNIPYIY